MQDFALLNISLSSLGFEEFALFSATRVCNFESWPVLAHAVYLGFNGAVKCFLSHGAHHDFSIVDAKVGIISVLCLAVQRGSPEVVQTLLEHNANLHCYPRHRPDPGPCDGSQS